MLSSVMHWSPIMPYLIFGVWYFISFHIFFALKLHIDVHSMIKVERNLLFMVFCYSFNQMFRISPTLKVLLFSVFLNDFVADLTFSGIPITLDGVSSCFLCRHLLLAIRTCHYSFLFFLVVAAIMIFRH